jgi:predicted aspartyl protease
MRLLPLPLVTFVALVQAASAAQQQSEWLSAALAPLGFRPAKMQALRDGRLGVTVKINSKPARLLLSVAAPLTALDRRSSVRLGLLERPSGYYVDGPLKGPREDYGMAKVRGVEIAGIVLSDFDVAVMNLPSPKGNSLDGTFGTGQLMRLNAVIDCGARLLYLNPKGRPKQRVPELEELFASHGYTRIPMTINLNRHFEVPCALNGRPSKIIIEPAAVDTIIARTLARNTRVSLSDSGYRALTVAGGSAPMDFGVAQTLSIGNFQTTGTRISVLDARFNTLGIDFLRSHNAVIDTGGMNLYLRHR